MADLCKHCGKPEAMADDNSCQWCGGWGCDRCEGSPEDDDWCEHDAACHAPKD